MIPSICVRHVVVFVTYYLSVSIFNFWFCFVVLRTYKIRRPKKIIRWTMYNLQIIVIYKWASSLIAMAVSDSKVFPHEIDESAARADFRMPPFLSAALCTGNENSARERNSFFNFLVAFCPLHPRFNWKKLANRPAVFLPK